MQVGLVGVGHRGEVLAESLPAGYTLGRVAGRRRSTVKSFADLYGGIPGSLDDILNDDQIPAVLVATDIDQLYDVACNCLSAGKHLFLEKPGATTAKQIEELQALQATWGTNVAVGYSWLDDFWALNLQPWNASGYCVNWEHWTANLDSVDINLLCHPLAWILSRLPKEAEIVQHSLFGPPEERTLKVTWNTEDGPVWCAVHFIRSHLETRTITIFSGDGNSIQVRDKLGKMNVDPTGSTARSVQRQLGSFLDAVARDQEYLGPNQLELAGRVLRTLGR